MGPKRGRPKRGQLADMGVYPIPPECYEPPPGDECDEFPPITFEVAVGHRIGIRVLYRKGTTEIVYFATFQATKVDGQWHQVARIDCSHGTIHKHQFTRSGDNHRTDLERIPARHGLAVIEQWVGQAESIMQNEWEDNLRRWTGDNR